MKRRLALCALLAVLCASPGRAATDPDSAPVSEDDAGAPPSAIETPDRLTPTIGLDELERGMRGYGVSVFQGVEPEPFPFEVVAVIRDARPGRSIVWVRCTGQRMRFSGPVQGMSGSPMYVWDEDEPQRLGEGGRLVGAFAFGYQFSKECYIGVQPIRYMRRLADAPPEEDAEARLPGGAAVEAARRTLRTLAREAPADSLSATRVALARRMVSSQDAASPTAPRRAPSPHHTQGVEPLRLPIDLGSSELASFAAPLIEPFGLRAVAGRAGGGVAAAAVADGGGGQGGEGRSARLAPGSALAIPLISGDWDAAAAGTVTDVLPDGTVLGFGHPMMGFGPTAMPMATGEIHFVMPRLDVSFKQSSSLETVGTIRRDAAAGVAGGPGRDYETAEVTAAVNQIGVPRRDYRYRVAEVPGMTATFAAVAAMQSLAAVQGSPLDSTTRMRATMRFEGGHELTLDTLAPRAQPRSLAGDLLMPMALMTGNTFEPTRLLELNVRFDVEPTVRAAVIADATLQSVSVASGERTEVVVTLRPHGGPPERRRISLRVPPGVPEGDYMLTIGDARTYLGATLGGRPHMLNPGNLAELRATLQRIVGVESDALYLVLQLPGRAVAVGASEMPQLPSSRAAIIATPTSSRASIYSETVEAIEPVPYATLGSRSFTLSVRRPVDRAKAGGEQ